MQSMSFFFPGKPKPLQRHRKSKSGGYYDPSKADKKEIGVQAAISMNKNNWRMYEPHVFLKATFVFVFLKPKKPKGQWPMSGGDLSNLIKLIEDALNKVAYWDDRQIVQYGESGKEYGVDSNVGIYLSLEAIS